MLNCCDCLFFAHVRECVQMCVSEYYCVLYTCMYTYACVYYYMYILVYICVHGCVHVYLYVIVCIWLHVTAIRTHLVRSGPVWEIQSCARYGLDTRAI